jgi:hypothetical protein
MATLPRTVEHVEVEHLHGCKHTPRPRPLAGAKDLPDATSPGLITCASLS